jgi:hypothetical protein
VEEESRNEQAWVVQPVSRGREGSVSRREKRAEGKRSGPGVLASVFCLMMKKKSQRRIEEGRERQRRTRVTKDHKPSLAIELLERNLLVVLYFPLFFVNKTASTPRLRFHRVSMISAQSVRGR